MLTAFDYDKQEWVQGEAARPIRIAQIQETLEILWSDRGAQYLVNTHKRGEPVVTVAEAIAMSEKWLRELATN